MGSYTSLTIYTFLFTFNVGKAILVNWTLNTFPVIFGEQVHIACTIYDKKPPGHMAWKKYSGGDNMRTFPETIGFFEVSSDITKYDLAVRNKEQSVTYELVIKHFNINDVNNLYRCEIGFSNALGEISLKECVALPKPDQIQQTYDLTDGRLHAIIRMPQVYPRPRCAVVFKDRNITNMSNTTCIEQGILYTAVLKVFYDTKECTGDLTILCIVGIRNITLKHRFDGCPETATNKKTGVLLIATTVTVLTLLLLGVVVVLIYLRMSSYATRHVFQRIDMGTLRT